MADDEMLSKYILPSSRDDANLKNLAKDWNLEDIEFNFNEIAFLKTDPEIVVFPRGMGFPYSWMRVGREIDSYPRENPNRDLNYDRNINLLAEALSINPNL